MFDRDGLRSFNVTNLNVGLCSSAVEMVMGLTGKTKQDCQSILRDVLKPSTSESKRTAAEALLCRWHVIPGFNTPTPLITFREGMQLVRLLPAKHVQHVINHVDATFQQVTAGDPRIHFRVAENAASDASAVKALSGFHRGYKVLSSRLDCLTLREFFIETRSLHFEFPVSRTSPAPIVETSSDAPAFNGEPRDKHDNLKSEAPSAGRPPTPTP